MGPMDAGGPYDMKLTARNKITIHNVLIGDVRICSGQSNMVHNFGRHQKRYAKETAAANIPEIRQFYVPTSPLLTVPAKNIPGLKWEGAIIRDYQKTMRQQLNRHKRLSHKTIIHNVYVLQFPS
jgi:sialate O-acetylesterase